MSSKGARYVFNVLLREASFARAIRISTLPIRLSSLASGVSMLDKMVTKSVSFAHDNWKWKSLDEAKMTVKTDEMLYPYPIQSFNLPQADAACVSILINRLTESWSDRPRSEF